MHALVEASRDDDDGQGDQQVAERLTEPAPVFAGDKRSEGPLLLCNGAGAQFDVRVWDAAPVKLPHLRLDTRGVLSFEADHSGEREHRVFGVDRLQPRIARLIDERQIHQYDDGLRPRWILRRGRGSKPISTDDKLSFTLRQEITDLQLAVERKRSEIGNLVTGYRRAVEGIGAIPSEPLRRNLVEARAELTVLERRLAELHVQAEAG